MIFPGPKHREDSMIPTDHTMWRHCIEVECGISLSRNFVSERLHALSNPNDSGTQQFIKVWGAAHRDRVLAWFARAGDEL